MGTRKTPFGTFGSLRCTYAANATAEIYGRFVWKCARGGGDGMLVWRMPLSTVAVFASHHFLEKLQKGSGPTRYDTSVVPSRVSPDKRERQRCKLDILLKKGHDPACEL